MAVLGNTIVKDSFQGYDVYAENVYVDEITFSGSGYTAYAFNSDVTVGDNYTPIYCTTNKKFASWTNKIVDTSCKVGSGGDNYTCHVGSWSVPTAGGSIVALGESGQTYMPIAHTSMGTFTWDGSDRFILSSFIWTSYQASDGSKVHTNFIWGGVDSSSAYGWFDASTHTLHSTHTSFPETYVNIGYTFRNLTSTPTVKYLIINDPNSCLHDGCEYTLFNNLDNNMSVLVGCAASYWIGEGGEQQAGENLILGGRELKNRECVTLIRCGKYWYINNGSYTGYN